MHQIPSQPGHAGPFQVPPEPSEAGAVMSKPGRLLPHAVRAMNARVSSTRTQPTPGMNLPAPGRHPPA